MPAPTDVIQALTTPPLVSLQQVLDTDGPFFGGDYTLSSFTTNGAFLLPAGTYALSGTYGVICATASIPPAAARFIGFNGLVNGQDKSEDNWTDRIAQIVIYHTLPITGLVVATQRIDVHFTLQMEIWEAFSGSAPDFVGLHVFPNFSVDLYWMCVL